MNPFASSKTHLTRLSNRGETVESRVCTVVAVLRARAEGGIGGHSFVRDVRELFTGDVCFDDPCLLSALFRLRVFRLLAWAEAGVYDGQYGGLFR